METKNPAYSWFQFVNPNGISLKDDNLDITLLCETMLKYGTDHFGLLETTLDTMCHEVWERICDESKKRLQISNVNMASLWIPVQNFYKPGGVMSLAQGDIIGRKISDGSDPLGCWVYTKYAAKGNRIVTFIAVYWPCKPSKQTGTTTYHQQLAMLK
eukprot:4929347-Ditylum_brightwellii.AAC.1